MQIGNQKWWTQEDEDTSSSETDQSNDDVDEETDTDTEDTGKLNTLPHLATRRII